MRDGKQDLERETESWQNREQHRPEQALIGGGTPDNGPRLAGQSAELRTPAGERR